MLINTIILKRSLFWSILNAPIGNHYHNHIYLINKFTMENFKVRAWDKANKKMFQVTSYLAFDKKGDIMAIDDRPIAEFELMQYTGRRDKNLKEIYEKDIVKVWVYDEEGNIFELLGIFEVFYDEELCMFSIKNKDGNWSPNSLGVFKQIEVIGNVFENPELIDK